MQNSWTPNWIPDYYPPQNPRDRPPRNAQHKYHETEGKETSRRPASNCWHLL